MIGWGNVSMKNGELHCALGYVGGEAPRDAAFASGLDAELARMREFLTPKRGVMTEPLSYDRRDPFCLSGSERFRIRTT